MRNWKEYVFSEAVDCNPSIPLKKGVWVENCEMEDIEPQNKVLRPRKGKLYNGGNSKFQNGDTVFARITPCLENGKIAQIKDLKGHCGIGSTEFFIFRGKKDISDSDFIHYLCRSNLIKETAINSMTGASGRQRADLKAIKKTKVFMPPLTEQKEIAKVLGNFDELIDLNSSRIELIETISKEIYKEWFVRMRFPSCSFSKLVKGVPSNWTSVPLSEVVSNYIGGGWGNDVVTKEYSTPGYVIRGTDIPKIKSGQVNLEILRYHKTSNMKSRELIEGDIIFETAGGSEGQPLGRTCYITQEILDAYGDKVMAASFCKQIRTTSIPSMYLYYFLNYLWDTGMIETYQVQSTGISNFQFEPFLKFQQIILPDQDLMQKFHYIVLPMHKQIATLGTQNAKLREIRDRLLPRLISGKLQVKSGEIESEEPSSTKEANLA